MQISYNWLKKLIDFEYTANELGNLLTSIGFEVEEIRDLSKKYKNFYIGKVTECKPHPNADKLSLCKVSLGTETFSVVCGAPNVKEGQIVPFAKSGAIVPVNDLQLDTRKIRGELSEGMICSQWELELGDDKSGIWVLPENTPNGVLLTDYFNLNDYIIEVAVTPNRADALSHFGIAREIAAQKRIKFNKPEVIIEDNNSDINDFISIEIQAREKCPRYSARVVYDAQITESPAWLKYLLISIGLRPVNAVVDVTNYILFETGQPLHAFDYNKIQAQKIIVKTATNGTQFTTLDGKERTLTDEMLLICDALTPIAIGGVMGGENSEINNETKNILIESAYFEPSSIRKTAKKLGISSDSSYRFERGVDYENVLYALNKATKLIAEFSGGKIAKGLIDVKAKEIKQQEVELRFERACKVIGAEISKSYMLEMLQALEFKTISIEENKATFLPPSYRVDIKQEIDLIEEVARMYGYNNLVARFESEIDFSSEPIHPKLAIPPAREKISQWLIHNGFIETLNQNQTDPKSAALYTDNPVLLANPLGEELSIMRPSLIPSMLKTVRLNLRMANYNLALFEIGKIFEHNNSSDNFIKGFSEKENLCIAITGNLRPKQWGIQNRNVDFYDIKGIVSDLLDFLKIENYQFVNNDAKQSKTYENECLQIMDNENEIGTFGKVNSSLLDKYEIEQNVYICLIDLSKLYTIKPRALKYKKVPAFPGITRDLAFIVPKETEAQALSETINMRGTELLRNVTIFDVFEGKSMEENKKSIAYSLYFQSPERTLKDEEIEKIIQNVVNEIEKLHFATLRKF